jgi:hypothetical protein
MPDSDNFREVQYYAMLKEIYGSTHVAAKTVYQTNCNCKDCNHSWRGECMKAKCTCCTTPA